MSKRLTPSRLAWIYGSLAAFWILVSDSLLILVYPNEAIQGWIELTKGLLFVAVTSTLLYLLLRSWHHDLIEAFDRQRQADARLRAHIDESTQAIIESEARYRSLFENNHAVMLIVDPESGAIIDANPAAEGFYGWPRRTLTGMNIMEINTLAPEQIRTEMQAARIARRNHFEFRHRLADGSIRDVDVYSGRIFMGGRELLYSIVHDVTDRKGAQQALAASEARLRQLSLAVEQSPNSIVITDLDTRIQYVNDAFLNSTGYTREEVLGRNPRLLQSGKTPCSTYETLWASLTQGRPWKGEFHNRRKDGREYIEFAHVAPLHQADGAITHYVAVKEDITEKKRIGEELDRHRHHLEELVEQRTTELVEARRQAETANRAKSAFLANMSHEIRTPMNGVLGMVELLARTPLTPEQRQKLDTIRESGKSLIHLIDDILDFSKIEAGRLELEHAPVALRRLVESLCESLTPLAQSREVDLTGVVDPRVPEWVLSDEVRLRQLLYNLVGNGIKFARGSETHRGRVRVQLAPGPHQAPSLTLSVEDNGIGMSEEVRSRLFRPFAQAESSTTRRFGGTGLGLTICKRVVDLMGGTIEVESTPDVGSTFRVHLPLEPIQAPESEPAVSPDDLAQPTVDTAPTASSARSEPASERRVLVAEDDEINQEVIQLQLDMLGYRADLAANGVEALELWRAGRGRYLALLTDLHMPEMDGYALTAQIRREEAERTAAGGRTEHLPILALTANALLGEAERAQGLGLDDYLTKPLMLEDLERALARRLGTDETGPT